MKKKVILVNCVVKSGWLQPVAVLSIAEALLRHKYEVVIIDGNYENIIDRLSKTNLGDVLCVGISTWSGPGIEQGIEASRYIKEANPKIPVVWGGIHASLLPDQTINNSYIDVIVRAEGEEMFLELLSCFEAGGSIDKVKGITYLDKGVAINTQDRDFIDLNIKNSLPYELLDTEKYFFREYLLFPTSRGCPYKCIFCYNLSYNKLSWRFMSAEKVLEHLGVYIKKFNPKMIGFTCEDNFFVNKPRVRQICEGILKNKYEFKWDATCRADYLASYDKEFMRLLKDSGCKSFNIGAESGSPAMLKKLQKNITVENIIKSANKCLETGIEPIYSFICGVPGEKKEDFELTLDLLMKLKEIGATVNGLFIATSHPGTPLFKLAVENGLSIPQTLEEWSKWQMYIEDENGTPWLTKKERNKFRVCSEIVRFFFLTKDFGKGKYPVMSWSKVKHMIYSALFPIMSFLGRMRLRKRMFSFPLEWKLWLLYKSIFQKFY